MNPILEPVPDGFLFDTDEVLSLAQLLGLRAAGFLGGIRTVTGAFEPGPDPSDITAAETEDFMRAGLGLMVYQRVRNPGWLPTAALGTADGQVLVRKVATANLIKGTTLWDDLEEVGGTAANTTDYANSKETVVSGAAFESGEYEGAGVPLTGDQWYYDMRSGLYWRSASSVPTVSVRGYCLEQIAEDVVVAGVKVDVNVARADKKGARAHWMRNAS